MVIRHGPPVAKNVCVHINMCSEPVLCLAIQNSLISPVHETTPILPCIAILIENAEMYNGPFTMKRNRKHIVNIKQICIPAINILREIQSRLYRDIIQQIK